MEHVLLVGLGSSHGDDCVGWLVADRLRMLLPERIAIRKAASPAEIFDWIDGVERLVICDACVGAGTPGQIFPWTWPDLPVDRLRHGGTHNMSLPDMLELARRLGRLPASVEVLGIEVVCFKPGAPLSPELTGVVTEVACDLRERLGRA